MENLDPEKSNLVLIGLYRAYAAFIVDCNDLNQEEVCEKVISALKQHQDILT